MAWPDAESERLLNEIIDMAEQAPPEDDKTRAKDLAAACRDTHVDNENGLLLADHQAAVRRAHRHAERDRWFNCCGELEHGSGGGGVVQQEDTEDEAGGEKS
jgi:hypothetical protein